MESETATERVEVDREKRGRARETEMRNRCRERRKSERGGRGEIDGQRESAPEIETERVMRRDRWRARAIEMERGE